MSQCTCMLRRLQVAAATISDARLTATSGPDPREVQHAKELCEDLLGNVKEQYERFKENPPPQHGGYGGSGGYQQRGSDRQSYGGYGTGYGSGYGGQQSPAPLSAMSPTSQAPPGAGSLADYGAQYAQYYGGQDPYAAYGGYQNYVAYYQYYQQQAAQQQQQQAPPGASPPGPPSDPPPPPPPSGSPPGANGSTYGAVCSLSLITSHCQRLTAIGSATAGAMRLLHGSKGWPALHTWNLRPLIDFFVILKSPPKRSE